MSYTNHNANAEPDVSSEDAPMMFSTGAGAEAGRSGEDASVVNLPNQAAQSASTDRENSAPDAAALPPPAATYGRRDTKAEKAYSWPSSHGITDLPAHSKPQERCSQFRRMVSSTVAEILSRRRLEGSNSCHAPCLRAKLLKI